MDLSPLLNKLTEQDVSSIISALIGGIGVLWGVVVKKGRAKDEIDEDEDEEEEEEVYQPTIREKVETIVDEAQYSVIDMLRKEVERVNESNVKMRAGMAEVIEENIGNQSIIMTLKRQILELNNIIDALSHRMEQLQKTLFSLEGKGNGAGDGGDGAVKSTPKKAEAHVEIAIEDDPERYMYTFSTRDK